MEVRHISHPCSECMEPVCHQDNALTPLSEIPVTANDEKKEMKKK